jgi:DNA-directed RNA polymerase subunit H (RpoH/RPB5)
MDYETLNVLYQSRKTLLKILAARGYATKAFEKFGPLELNAMVSAGPLGTALRMDLQRTPEDAKKAGSSITICRVEYSFARLKNRLAAYTNGFVDEDAGEDAVDPTTTEVFVITLEPIVDAFHAAALSILATKKLRIYFFQAHTLVNNPFEHVLVPKHELVPSEEHAGLLASHFIKSKMSLPIIKFHEDMIARLMCLQPGDIVKITRPSPQAGTYVAYRVCAP